jgi:predicted dehydrogenase
MTTLAGRIDWKKSDPTLDAFLKFKNGPTAHLVAADEHQYSIFDLDLLFEKGRIYLSQFGNIITYYQTKEQEKLHRYKIKNTGLKTTIFTALANLINSLEGKEKLLCSGADALETQKACLKLIEIYKKGNAWKN